MTFEGRRNGRVLVVDWRNASRVELLRQLERNNYSAVGASNPAAARDIARMDEKLDFAVVDLDQGSEGVEEGLETAIMIARQRPRTRIVLLSGNECDQTVGARIAEVLHQEVGYVWTMNPESRYVEDVLSELGRFAKLKEKRKCFVIMPFSATASVPTPEIWTDIFDSLIKVGAEASQRYECSRSGPLTGNVIEQIFDSLNSADVVIADLTDRNANVFYELGVRHTLQDSTILLAQRMSDVPSDLNGNATICYEYRTSEGRRMLVEAIGKALDSIDNAIEGGREDLLRSPVRKYTCLKAGGKTAGSIGG